MRWFKWWVALELYLAALIAVARGHSNLAIVLAVAAVVVTLVALELGAEPDDDEASGLTVERLALVLVYAWPLTRAGRLQSRRRYFDYCRRAAIGLEQGGNYGTR